MHDDCTSGIYQSNLPAGSFVDTMGDRRRSKHRLSINNGAVGDDGSSEEMV